MRGETVGDTSGVPEAERVVADVCGCDIGHDEVRVGRTGELSAIEQHLAVVEPAARERHAPGDRCGEMRDAVGRHAEARGLCEEVRWQESDAGKFHEPQAVRARGKERHVPDDLCAECDAAG